MSSSWIQKQAELDRQRALLQQRKLDIEQRLQQKQQQAGDDVTNISKRIKVEAPTLSNDADSSGSNKFNNDGSFLEQFRTMQKPPDPVEKPPIVKQATQGISMKLSTPKTIINNTLELKPAAAFCNEDDDESINERICPPEDIAERVAAEQLAIMVSVGGEEVEGRVRNNHVNNPAYSWLMSSDTNTYKYYKQYLADRKQKQEEKQMKTEPVEKKRKSRWGPDPTPQAAPLSDAVMAVKPSAVCTAPTGTNPHLITYAFSVFGSCDLTPDQWKQLNDQLKMKMLFEELMKKKRDAENLAKKGKVKYEYDSDEEVEGGTWEHKRRAEEMEKTKGFSDFMTEMGQGKHHIGDFLPPDELAKFMEKFDAIQEGREADLSDYKEHKITNDNIGFKMLQKLGWEEGQGLGAGGAGIKDPVNKGAVPVEKQGLGQHRPDDLQEGDNEYDAYRKRMTLAYRFRPNPLNNPRRPYY